MRDIYTLVLYRFQNLRTFSLSYYLIFVMLQWEVHFLQQIKMLRVYFTRALGSCSLVRKRSRQRLVLFVNDDYDVLVPTAI